MSASPWVKWFSADFLNGISDLEPNEIAVYSVVLNLIYDNEGPIKDDAVKIGRRCNMRPTSAEKSLASLSSAGKITRENGEISNHRCEKEIKSRQKVSEKSSESANARWKNHDKKPNEINKAPMRMQSVGICETDAIYKPEADSKKTEPLVPNTHAGAREFAEFWELYPHKVGRGIAEKSFLAARRRADQPTLIAGLHRYIESKPPDRDWCNPSTWLNQQRWLDAPANPQSIRRDNRNERPNSFSAAFDRLEARIIGRTNHEPEEPERRDGSDDFGGRLQLVARSDF